MDFREKSKQSISNAEFLHQQSLYLSVPHCAYYSTYQTIMNILKLNPDIDSIPPSPDAKGLHEKVISKVFQALRVRGMSYREFRGYHNMIFDLKALRTDADYREVLIDSSKSSTSIEYSKKASNFLNSNFQI